MQVGSWGSPGSSTPWISYANELLGIPRLTYLKKMLSVCGRGEVHLLLKSCDFLCKWARGIPRSSFTSRHFWFLMQTGSCGSPGPLTSRNLWFLMQMRSKGSPSSNYEFLMQMRSWGFPGSLTWRTQWLLMQVRTPRLMYLKKSMISYGNVLLGVHLLKEIIDVLCKRAPGVPGGSFTWRSCGFLMQMNSWGSLGSLT